MEMKGPYNKSFILHVVPLYVHIIVINIHDTFISKLDFYPLRSIIIYLFIHVNVIHIHFLHTNHK